MIVETRIHMKASLPSSESRDVRDVSPKETPQKDGPTNHKALQQKHYDEDGSRCLQSISETLAKPINIDSLQEEDEEDMFGRLVAMKLRRITNTWMRTETIRIMQVMMDAEYPPNNEWFATANGSFMASMQS